MQYKVNFGKIRMDQLCFMAPLYYDPCSINSYLVPIQPFQNNYYYVVYPSSPVDDSHEISAHSQERSVILKQRNDFEVGSQINASSQSENKKSRRMERNENSLKQILIDQQFQVSIPIKKKGTLYKKKNTESNIINQALSFINSERSLPFLSKLLENSEEKIRWFYKMMAGIKKANKKYTNRKYLKRLIEFGERSEFHRVYLKQKNIQMTLGQVRTLIRKLVFYFVRDYSYLSLLTSSKIYKETLREHFWRKREILNFLFNLNKEENVMNS